MTAPFPAPAEPVGAAVPVEEPVVLVLVVDPVVEEPPADVGAEVVPPGAAGVPVVPVVPVAGGPAEVEAL